MDYTIGEIADLAGVSTRTLRHYDAVGLLVPAARGNGSTRLYDDDALLRLQQIMFYRELDFRLDEIAALLDSPDYDVLQALQRQKQLLQQRAGRIGRLLLTIDRTIEHVKRRVPMTKESMFDGFSEEKQREYAAEARQRWGAERVDRSMKVWNGYSDEQREEVMAEGQAIYEAVVRDMKRGHDSPEVQKQMAALHAHFQRFYDCSLEIFRNLGEMYTQDPRFGDNFRRLHPELPEFLRNAMAHYADRNAAR